MSKKAVITGASRGIGRGIALELAGRGYDVAYSYATSLEDAQTLKQEIESIGQRAFYYQASLEIPGEGEKFFDRAVEDLGGLDVLINNAGVTIFGSVYELEDSDLDYMINLDFRNYIVMMRAAARYMISHNIRGTIVNITSSRGERAYPDDGIYGGLKAALNRAIQSFALDVAKFGIRINNVAPGAIAVRTPEQNEKENNTARTRFYEELGERIPAKRMGLPGDIAKAVAFLVSEDADYITGVTLRIDGGLILPGMPEVTPEGMEPGDWDIHQGKQNIKF